jgi:beta-phosphoglucomutase
MRGVEACIFDLDGVIVDTAVYHYRAWRRLANELGFDITEEQNEQLKGVSRMRSLDIILGIGKISATPDQHSIFADRKNTWYLEFIEKMTPDEILPGSEAFVSEVRSAGIKTAIGSASKNTNLILAKIGMSDYFDAIIDGNKVTKAKPDPEVFLNAAIELSANPTHCVVFEDAIAGVQAAKNANMLCIGIGEDHVLLEADFVVSSLAKINLEQINNLSKINNKI